MAGSIRSVRQDVWELRVYVGRDQYGRTRHLPLTVHGSRRAAEKELARLVADQETSPAPIPEEPVRWGPTRTHTTLFSRCSPARASDEVPLRMRRTRKSFPLILYLPGKQISF